MIVIDPDAPVRESWWPGGSVRTDPAPHFASVVTGLPDEDVVPTDVGRVSQVSDETDPVGAAGDADDDDRDEVAADQTAEIEAAMAEAKARLADVPAEVVVTNHVMGLFELAAIHLSSDEPDLAGASLAIDAMAAMVEGLGDRLGDDTPAMRDALANIRMAYVTVRSANR